jgi:hypothetical protein
MCGRIVGVLRIPCVSVAHADTAQGLEATPEPDAGRLRRRILVSGQDHVNAARGNEVLDESGDSHGLQLAFVFEAGLKVRLVVHEQQRLDLSGVWISAASVTRLNKAVRGLRSRSISCTFRNGQRLAN